MEKPHKKLDVWRLSMELTEAVYRITAGFPADEKFGLVTQMRRAVVSVPSNLAEGAARSSDKEFMQFISIARGSLSELDTQLDIAVQLGLLEKKSRQDLDAVLIRIDKMLYALRQSQRPAIE
jgi:four helix bundle protein